MAVDAISSADPVNGYLVIGAADLLPAPELYLQWHMFSTILLEEGEGHAFPK